MIHANRGDLGHCLTSFALRAACGWLSPLRSGSCQLLKWRQSREDKEADKKTLIERESTQYMLVMDIDSIAKYRQNRKSPSGAPLRAFYAQFDPWINGANEVKQLSVSQSTKWLIERSLVISGVTAIEVYFRDMLDVIFRSCRADVFSPKLRELHKEKYDIDEIVEIYQKQINPCELVLAGLSFQRMDTIEKMFSTLINKPFWKSAVPVQIRLKDDHTKQFEVTDRHVKSLRSLLALRHELVHDPDKHKHKLTEEEISWLYDAGLLMFACDIVLNQFIAANIDLELKSQSTK